jgi:hypothetical protein
MKEVVTESGQSLDATNDVESTWSTMKEVVTESGRSSDSWPLLFASHS